MMIRCDVTRWINASGKVCFRFSEREPFERAWIIVAISFILIAIVGVEYLVNRSYFSLFPIVIIQSLALLWWVSLPMKANEAVVEQTVHDILDDIVKKDAEVKGVSVKKSFVHYDTKGTYAIVTGIYFLVLLDNGDVWEYPIIYHKPTESERGFYECEETYIVSENQRHIQAIHPRRLSRFINKLDLSDKTKLGLLWLAIFIVSGVLFSFFCWLFFKLKLWALLLIGVCICLIAFMFYLGRKAKGKTVENVASFLSSVFVMLTEMTKPFTIVLGTFLFVFVFLFGILTLVLKGVDYVGWLALKPETIVFVVISLGSILCSNHRVTKAIIRHSPMKNWGNHSFESCREQLAVYLVHPSNVVFLIYMTYFIFLAVSGFLQIQCGRYLISEGFDASILKAFLVYIAYTNTKKKASGMELDVSELLKGTLRLFERDEM